MMPRRQHGEDHYSQVQFIDKMDRESSHSALLGTKKTLSFTNLNTSSHYEPSTGSK